MEKCIQHYRNIWIHIRFAQSLMALNVNLKFSLFGTRYKISSVTRQPVRQNVRNLKHWEKYYTPTVHVLIPSKRRFQFQKKTNFCSLDSYTCHTWLLQMLWTIKLFYSCTKCHSGKLHQQQAWGQYQLLYCMHIIKQEPCSVPLRLRIHRMSKFLRMESPLRSRLSGMDCKASLAKSRSIYSDRDRKVEMKQYKSPIFSGLNT